MVEEIFAYVRRSGTVEIDGGNDGRIVRDKEISVYGGEQRYQHIGRDAEGDSSRQHCADGRRLAE